MHLEIQLTTSYANDRRCNLRVADLEKVEHYTKELKRLVKVKKWVIDNATTHLNLRFYGSVKSLEQIPFVTIGVQDREFSAIYGMAQACISRDIQEISIILKDLGVDATEVVNA